MSEKKSSKDNLLGKSPKEAIQEAVQRFEKMNLVFSQREGEANYYEQSDLDHWLMLDSWTDEEAFCLIFDINPEGAKIRWDGYKNFHDVHIDKPKIEQADFLGEKYELYSVPHRNLHKFENLADDDDMHYKRYRIAKSEEALAPAWRIFKRRKHDGVPFGGESPLYYINWALENDIEPPWLSWAEENGYFSVSNSGNDDSPSKVTVPDKREIRSELKLIAALLDTADFDRNASGANVPKAVEALTDAYGHKVSANTIRRIFRDISREVDEG